MSSTRETLYQRAGLIKLRPAGASDDGGMGGGMGVRPAPPPRRPDRQRHPPVDRNGPAHVRSEWAASGPHLKRVCTVYDGGSTGRRYNVFLIVKGRVGHLLGRTAPALISLHPQA